MSRNSSKIKALGAVTGAVFTYVRCLTVSANVVFADSVNGGTEETVTTPTEINETTETETANEGVKFMNRIAECIDDCNILQALIILAVILACIVTILTFIRSKKTRNFLEKGYKENEQLVKDLKRECYLCIEVCLKARQSRERIEQLINGDDTSDGLLKFTENLNSDQLKWLGIDEYINKEYINEKFASAVSLKSDVFEIKAELEEVPTAVLAIKKNSKDTKTSLKSINNINRKLKNYKKTLERGKAALKEENCNADKAILEVKDACKAAENFSNAEIRHNITISDISNIKGASGALSARDFAGNYIKGCHKIDDIRLLGRRGTLGGSDNLGPINMYVHGSKGEDSICLRSTNEFGIKLGAEEMKHTRSAKLHAGTTYDISVHTAKGKVNFKLAVE